MRSRRGVAGIPQLQTDGRNVGSSERGLSPYAERPLLRIAILAA